MTAPYNPDDQERRKIAHALDVEANMLAFADDLKYPMTLPRGPKGQRAVLLLDYLYPDLQHILAGHFIQRGWRRHDELAVIKPRKIIGGLFEDLVAYVPVDEPDDPIVVPRPPYNPDQPPPQAPDVSDLAWSVKPVLNEQFEERPPDDQY